MRCWPRRQHREAALQLLAWRESSARVALLAATAFNTYLTLPLYATCKEEEGQPIAEGTIRSSKAPGQPHKCHHHLQNEIKLKRMPVRNAVDQERLR